MKTEINFEKLKEIMRLAKHKTVEYLCEFEPVESDISVFLELQRAYRCALEDDINKRVVKTCESYFGWSNELEYRFGRFIRFVKVEGKDRWVIKMQARYHTPTELQYRIDKIADVMQSYPFAFVAALSDDEYNKNKYSRQFYSSLLDILEG